MNPDAIEQALAAERLPVNVVDVAPGVLNILDIETAGAIKAGPVFDLSDGIADDLARISDTVASDGLRALGSGRLPWNYVVTTLGAAIAAAYGLGLVLKAAGLKGPIPMAAAGVAAPLVIEVIQKRRQSE